MERAFLFWLGYMVTHTFELHGSRDVRLQAPTDPVPDLAPPYTAWGCKIEIHNSSSFFVSQCFIAEFTISHITKKNKLFLCTERICMPIRSICFLLGQLLFIPSYFYMTKTLKKEKLRADSFVRFLLVCPPMAYIYTILCMGLLYRLLPGKISYDIIYGVDFFVFGISFLLMYFYGRMMEPVGSAARFLYLCLYLLSMPFTAIYDSLTMTVLIDLLMPLIINFIYCKWVCHPIVELREDCNRINGVLLTILIIAECLFLLRIAGFLFIERHVELKKFDVYFSVYSFIYAVFVLMFVFSAIIIIVQNIKSARINELAAEKSHEQSIETIESLVRAVDAKDSYTNGHSARVAKYTRQISKLLGYDDEKADGMYYMALLHDVGKIGVDDAILTKPGKLTDEEFAAIKAHTVIGSQILSRISSMPELQYGALYHHERWDGRGYPKGLKGEEIPEAARIIAVADAYDAMTSNRSYRKALTQDCVHDEILNGIGRQFWPPAARAMLKMIDQDIHYDMRQKNDESSQNDEQKYEYGIS